jgi:hypothetical protein
VAQFWVAGGKLPGADQGWSKASQCGSEWHASNWVAAAERPLWGAGGGRKEEENDPQNG